jgi:hypothetical protein
MRLQTLETMTQRCPWQGPTGGGGTPLMVLIVLGRLNPMAGYGDRSSPVTQGPLQLGRNMPSRLTIVLTRCVL